MKNQQPKPCDLWSGHDCHHRGVTTIAATPEANDDGVRRGKATLFAVKQCPADQR